MALEQFSEDGRDYISNALRGEIKCHLPDEVMLEFNKWIIEDGSKIMWVEGESSSFQGSALSLAAMRIYDLSIKEGIACLSFFAKPRYRFAVQPHPALSHKEAATVAMLYSIICQLARLLPPEFDPTPDLDVEKFQLLDGTLDSANVALQIIEALIPHTPRVLMCVLDGFQLAESKSTRPYLSSLMALLRAQREKKILKLCATTEGNSLVLAQNTGMRERVDASRMAQESPQGILRGASDISELRPFGPSTPREE